MATDNKRASRAALPDFGALGDLELLDDHPSGVQPIAEPSDEEMHRAFKNRDFERALALGTRPGAEESDLDRIVVPCFTLEQLAAAELDHRAAFLLSRIDGCTTVDDLLDVAGMPRLDALRYICDWVEQGLVSLE